MRAWDSNGFFVGPSGAISEHKGEMNTYYSNDSLKNPEAGKQIVEGFYFNANRAWTGVILSFFIKN